MEYGDDDDLRIMHDEEDLERKLQCQGTTNVLVRNGILEGIYSNCMDDHINGKQELAA